MLSRGTSPRRAAQALMLALAVSGAGAAPAGAVPAAGADVNYRALCASYGIYPDTPVETGGVAAITGKADPPNSGLTQGCQVAPDQAQLKVITYHPDPTTPGRWQVDPPSAAQFSSYGAIDAHIPFDTGTAGLCVLGRPNSVDAAHVTGYAVCWTVTASKTLPPQFSFAPMTDLSVLSVDEPPYCGFARPGPDGGSACNPGVW
ncbi:hypothetical protein KV557_06315 [Kitasatospora aureofaciens]|uniref:hypothetical protein n=1 Tax=Kitasatospora aureofaciens TaxID=1894 RepID=UPI001C46AEAA|nr:hypothetical protein [Kitasatospora aureofaciens]MBV6696739.1 hypothetical protein [Kitasatospora aureofaciens]